MKKSIIWVAALAMTMSVTSFTSCSDNIDDVNRVNQSSARLLSTADRGYNGTYSYSKLDGSESITININGEDATVSHDNVVPDKPNAQVVYQGDGEGYIQMNDSSLGIERIPFVAGAEMVELRFAGTDLFSGNNVVLTQPQIVTRSFGSNGEDTEQKFMTPEAKRLIECLTKAVTKVGSVAILGDYGEALVDPFLDLAFGGDEESRTQYLELESKINDLSTQLAKLGENLDMDNLKTEFSSHWEYINYLKGHNQIYVDKMCGSEKSIEEYLDDWARETVYNSSVESSFTSRLNMYSGQSNIDWFNDLDEYLIRTHGFLQQSYASRDLFRDEDMKVFTKTMQLMRLYFKSQNISENATSYKNMIDAYNNYVKAAANSEYIHRTDTVVCTIPGAYCTMHAATKTKVLGNNIDWYKEKSFGNSVRLDRNNSYWDHDGKWKYSYIYSDNALSPNNPNEIKTKCLSKNQATAIVNYYGGNAKLKDILKNEGKMTGFNNDEMLLSDWCYADWENYSWLYNDAKARINASIWDYKDNKYSDELLEIIYLTDRREVAWDWGVVIRKWFVFNSHTGCSLDYTDKIIDKDYTTTGSFSDTKSLMKYIKHIENRQ